MDNHENLQLKEPAIVPTSEMLEHVLGHSYAAYELLQDALPQFEIEQEWQWYTPYKAWFARGQHFWTTKRGTRKVKSLYWLYVYDGYFSVAVWFKDKNREELLSTDLSEETKKLIFNAATMGKLPTFPVVLDVTTSETLTEIYALLDWKKRLEL